MSDNQNHNWEIIQGDALKLLGDFSPGTFDAVITDPPYASGGRTQAEKNKSTAKKYSSMACGRKPTPPALSATKKRSKTKANCLCTTPETITPLSSPETSSTG